MKKLSAICIILTLFWVSCEDATEPEINVEALAVILETPTYVTGTSITLEWSKYTDEDFQSYRLYYSILKGVSETSGFAVKLTNNTLTSYTLTDLDTDVQYLFNDIRNSRSTTIIIPVFFVA